MNRNFILILIIVVVIGLSITFSTNNLNFAPEKTTSIPFVSAPSPVTIPLPAPIAPECITPIVVDSGRGPNIYQNNIVYISATGDSLKFYNAGSDGLFGTSDDIKNIQPSVLQFKGSVYPYIENYGLNILFVIQSQSYPWGTDFMIYNIGADGIPGTADDYGPRNIYSIPYSTPILLERLVHIDQNLVTFNGLGTLYYCTTNLPLGSCWTPSLSILQQSMVSNDRIRRFVGTGFAPTLYIFFWEQYLDNLFFNVNIGYKSLLALEEGLFYNSSLNEKLEDVTFPYILSGDYSPRQKDNKLKMGYVTIPMTYFPVSPSSIPGVPIFSDEGASISRNKDIAGNLLLSWIRYLPSIGGQPWQSNYVISRFTFPPGQEVTIPNIVPSSIPRVDKNNVVFSDNSANIYVTQCYF